VGALAQVIDGKLGMQSILFQLLSQILRQKAFTIVHGQWMDIFEMGFQQTSLLG
jgi:hypothetical protein